MLKRLAVVLVAFAFFVACVWVSIKISPAHARDPGGKYAGSQHENWYKSQHNTRGEWCCNEADAHPYYGDYTLNQDGSVSISGEKNPVPKDQVLLNTNNPTGAAVWWYIDVSGTKRTYCFAPGTLS